MSSPQDDDADPGRHPAPPTQLLPHPDAIAAIVRTVFSGLTSPAAAVTPPGAPVPASAAITGQSIVCDLQEIQSIACDTLAPALHHLLQPAEQPCQPLGQQPASQHQHLLQPAEQPGQPLGQQTASQHKH